MSKMIIKNCEFEAWFNEFSQKSGKGQRYKHFDYDSWRGIRKAIDWATNWELEHYLFGDNSVVISATNGTEGSSWRFDDTDNSFGDFLADKYSELLWKKAAENAREYAYTDSNGIDHIATMNRVNYKTTIKEKKKEKNTMFNFDFGPVKQNIVRMSPFGLAIRAVDGVWKSYNSKEKKIVDVDVFTFDASKFLYKMPVAIKDVKVGDIVIHNGEAMIVSGIEDNATSIAVVDVRHGETKNILPTYSPFGFDFITKVVSFLDMTGNATAESPFGNMLPFLMMNDSEDIDPMMFLFMGQNGGGNFDFASNPMMMYAFAQSNKGMNSNLPLWAMFLMNSNKQ